MDEDVEHPAEHRKIHARRRFGPDVVENLLFVVSTVLIFGFGAVVAEQIDWSWTLIVYAIAFWVVLAYLALPRLHRILTAIYVPSYFIGRTHTSDGMLGDPVNLAINGSEAQLHAAMTAAGWTLADPVTLRSSLKIIASSLARRSYPRAPVSPLVLFGSSQAFAYQQEVAGSPSKRHHVRFWKCPRGWLLPGGTGVDWLAAATFDKSVGLSLFTLQVTHKIDANIDIERDFVTGTIERSSPGVSITRLANFSTGYHSRNGGGDIITTDGALPVIDVSALPAHSASDEQAANGPSTTVDAIGRRPSSVVAALALSVAAIVMSIGGQIQQIDSARREILEEVESAELADTLVVAAIAIVVVIHLFIIFLTWRTYHRRRLARWVAIGVIIVAEVGQLGQYLGGVRPSVLELSSMAVSLLLIYALTSLSAREWTEPGSRAAPTT